LLNVTLDASAGALPECCGWPSLLSHLTFPVNGLQWSSTRSACT